LIENVKAREILKAFTIQKTISPKFKSAAFLGPEVPGTKLSLGGRSLLLVILCCGRLEKQF